MTERTARLDELLREEISAVIARDVDDPRVGFVTVTDVEVAPDLAHAKVWVSVIGSETERRTTLRALNRAMPFVRQRLGKLRLKRIPQLHVHLDTTAERGTRVLRILDDLESGREPGDVELVETLPTPTGRGPSEAAERQDEKPATRGASRSRRAGADSRKSKRHRCHGA